MNSNIWYLPGPFYQYQEDVKALAAEAGLRIIDANVTTDRDGAAENTPEVTLKQAPTPVVLVADDSHSVVIESLRRELQDVGVIVESLAGQDLHRPESELGQTAERLFQVLESTTQGIQSLTQQRDAEAQKVVTLQAKVDELLAKLSSAESEKKDSKDAAEIAELKAKLDAAQVTYRANASKESLQKQVDELPKA
ncbi:hypothetical protein [Pseudomonas sp. HY2-MNA-CIBAN-0224]|uniref:hypothetical protein n=1 Tax=Pseudomonas sp. HY2-MNA-CIBAN-0224 TaxID=3140471 RepID=UPI00331ECAAB